MSAPLTMVETRKPAQSPESTESTKSSIPSAVIQKSLPIPTLAASLDLNEYDERPIRRMAMMSAQSIGPMYYRIDSKGELYPVVNEMYVENHPHRKVSVRKAERMMNQKMHRQGTSTVRKTSVVSRPAQGVPAEKTAVRTPQEIGKALAHLIIAKLWG